MKKLLFILFAIYSPLFAEGPIYIHKDKTTNLEFQNVYQDIRQKIPIYSSGTYATLTGTQTFYGENTFNSSVTTNAPIDISWGGIGLNVGADTNAATRTNSTNKISKIVMPHYTNSQEPLAIISGAATTTTGIVAIGGGSASLNTATEIRMFTAADNVTTTGTQALTIDSGGRVLQPVQPNFLARCPVNTANVTGDGTVFTVEFDSEVFDQAANFSTTTYTFTAPVTGKYYFTAAVLVSGIASGNTGTGLITLVTSNRSYIGTYVANAYAGSLGGYVKMMVSAICDMDVNDTAYITVEVGGGSKVCEVLDTTTQHYFSGTLIN